MSARRAVAALQRRTSAVMGSPAGLALTLAFVAACLLSGLWLGLEAALLVLTTALSVMTQLTGQLIQGNQERQEGAIQRKLDELLRAIPQARNDLRGIERREEDPH